MPVSMLTLKYQATIPKRSARRCSSLPATASSSSSIRGTVRLRKAAAVASELHAVEATLAPEWTSDHDDAA